MDHSQSYGISQGCPLSPFLFAIVMTTLLHDAKASMPETEIQPGGVSPSELLYADDTLICDISAEHAEQFMCSIGSAGANYGLSFNWKKLEVLPVRCDADIHKPDGSSVQQKDSITHLGAVLSADGRVHTELARRIGAAEAEYKLLSRVWSHSTLNRDRKIQLFNSCIMSKLMYCLHTTWLNTAEQRKLDGFHCRCIRRIVGIKPSYVSRVSNASVFATATQERASALLLKRQMMYMNRISNLPNEDVLRGLVFDKSSFSLRQQSFLRKRSEERV